VAGYLLTGQGIAWWYKVVPFVKRITFPVDSLGGTWYIDSFKFRRILMAAQVADLKGKIQPLRERLDTLGRYL